MHSTPSRRALSIKELAEELGVSINKVRELLYSDPPRVRHVRVGRRVLIPASAVDEFLGGVSDLEDQE